MLLFVEFGVGVLLKDMVAYCWICVVLWMVAICYGIICCDCYVMVWCVVAVLWRDIWCDLLGTKWAASIEPGQPLGVRLLLGGGPKDPWDRRPKNSPPQVWPACGAYWLGGDPKTPLDCLSREAVRRMDLSIDHNQHLHSIALSVYMMWSWYCCEFVCGLWCCCCWCCFLAT